MVAIGDPCGYHDDKEGRKADTCSRRGRVQKRSAGWEEDEVEEQPSAKRRKPGEYITDTLYS